MRPRLWGGSADARCVPTTLPARGAVASVCATRWATDPLCRSAYSYVPLGRDAVGAPRALAELVRDAGGVLRLAFAGEATSPSGDSIVSRIGTVHGAWREGERAAGESAREQVGAPA